MFWMPLLQTPVVVTNGAAQAVPVVVIDGFGSQTHSIEVKLSGTTTVIPSSIQVTTAGLGSVVVAVLVLFAIIWTIRKMVLLANRS